MNRPRQWNLGIKLAVVATPFLILTLLAISATLWVSWQLEGGAAAVNRPGACACRPQAGAVAGHR